MTNKCKICGAYSGIYPLCKYHFQMRENGEVIKCNQCGTWYETKLGCPHCKKEQKHYCIFCDKQADEELTCYNCFLDIEKYVDSILSKNPSVYTSNKMRDYYYNLKEYISTIKNPKNKISQCKKLLSIAQIEYYMNDDDALINKVYKDIATLLDKKIEQIPIKRSKENEEDYFDSKIKINTAQDGHNVDSDMEVRIDDVLYNSYILHCYGKSIDEITEKRKKCDWFVPISNGKGIYIEYWGMDTEKYKMDRKEKEDLYKKYNIPYIGIEKDDPKQDSQTFKSNLIRDLKKLAIERYGFMPEWKK